jgi:hypothetical protein
MIYLPLDKSGSVKKQPFVQVDGPYLMPTPRCCLAKVHSRETKDKPDLIAVSVHNHLLTQTVPNTGALTTGKQHRAPSFSSKPATAHHHIQGEDI